ncbi:hypothetical protein LV716_08895 [Flagellimonas sp. HMM57]|uniref:hypothetical protein n=1 Tax=unclassified Flagellimonas TaxID=2644544 RepID=UPI0013D74D9A|nr:MULTISPECIES: hypothetical protein [unclassified Flagellimonas]UII77870.1 hypothetical protein LV716_08895 [Flagellimonas sp. HMM57]
MKPILLLLLFVLSNSCDESEDMALLENPENEQTIPQQQAIGPDEILFKIKILKAVEADKEICGTQKENVFGVEVVEVMVSGSSLNQKLSKKHQMDVSFLFKPNPLAAETIIEAKAKETLCEDSSLTYFTIIAHKILE